MTAFRLAARAVPAVVALVLALPASSSQGQKPALSVSIASPAGGATLRGPTRFSVRFRGLRPERVDFYVNGVRRHVDRRPPFAYRAGKVRLSELRRGRNTLRIVARRGSTQAEHRITVFVAQPQPAPPPRPPGSLTLQQPDGGTNYYARFANPLPTDPRWFPIAVWGSYAHETANINKDKAVGLNTYVWVADPSYIADVRASGMRVIQAQERRTGVGAETAGWLLSDEIDMTVGPSACPAQLTALRNSVAGDRRFVFDNYGKGVVFWQNDAQAACFVNYDDVNSADIYWFTDGNVCSSASEGPRFYGLEGVRALSQAECRRARNYGDVVQDMRRLDALNGSRHPIWNFIEVGCPFTGGAAGNCITPAQARAAVWHSLIAGARGILYFQHSFSGPSTTHHALRNARYQPMIDTITAVNAQIKSIASALNGPSVSSGFSVSGGARASARWSGSKFYVLAGSRENVASNGTFSIPCVGNATARVLGENRTIPITAGSFTDRFEDGNAVHVYRIDGGSTCGL